MTKQLEKPTRLNISSSFSIFSSENINKLLTPKRQEIIEFLRKENPFTKDFLIQKFGDGTEKELIVLEHLGLITLEKRSNEITFVKLNREVEIISL